MCCVLLIIVIAVLIIVVVVLIIVVVVLIIVIAVLFIVIAALIIVFSSGQRKHCLRDPVREIYSDLYRFVQCDIKKCVFDPLKVEQNP